MALIIKVLLENRLGKGQDSLLQAKPGLSLLVEDEPAGCCLIPGQTARFFIMRSVWASLYLT
jgi:7,8-dihydropterin-6-yl-methyl-4-(beta-D-ribofuranosyl)aminobenzene 5'-phosphate synthase